MSADKEFFQQYHHGEQEYCRQSGPLNSRKIKTPAALMAQILSSGLALAVAAAVATMLTLAIAKMYVTVAVRNIYETSAIFNVDILNREEGDQVTYDVIDPHTGESIAQGILPQDSMELYLEGLEPGTEYLLRFWDASDSEKEFLKEISFRTPAVEDFGQEPSVEPSTPLSVETGAATEPPTETEATTEPPAETEATTEPPTGTEATTEPPAETEATTEPPTGTEATTEPPAETEAPTEPPAETEPPTEPEPEPPTAGASALVSAAAVQHSGTVTGYRCVENFTFNNVVSEDCTITVTQGGVQVFANDIGRVYDAAAKTMTVTFTGHEIPAGQTAESSVKLTDALGREATKTQTVTTPKLESISMTAENLGYPNYRFSGTVTVADPQEGEFPIKLSLDLGNGTPVTVNTTNTSATTYSFSHEAEISGLGDVTITASGKWSIQTDTAVQTAAASVTPPAPELPTAGASALVSAAAVQHSGTVTGYRCVENFTFNNVASDACTITVTQGGVQIFANDIERVYDAAAKTMTVTFTGYEIPAGQTAESSVKLTDALGREATKTQTVTTPKLESISMTAENLGYPNYRFSGTVTVADPQEGKFPIKLSLNLGDGKPVSVTANGSGTQYTFSHEAEIPTPRNVTVTASGVWSIQTDATAQTAAASVTVTPALTITATMGTAQYGRYPYTLTMEDLNPGDRVVFTCDELGAEEEVQVAEDGTATLAITDAANYLDPVYGSYSWNARIYNGNDTMVGSAETTVVAFSPERSDFHYNYALEALTKNQDGSYSVTYSVTHTYRTPNPGELVLTAILEGVGNDSGYEEAISPMPDGNGFCFGNNPDRPAEFASREITSSNGMTTDVFRNTTIIPSGEPLRLDVEVAGRWSESSDGGGGKISNGHPLAWTTGAICATNYQVTKIISAGTSPAGHPIFATEQTHSFYGVPAPVTKDNISIMQGSTPIETFAFDYEEETGTVTVTFSTHPVTYDENGIDNNGSVDVTLTVGDLTQTNYVGGIPMPNQDELTLDITPAVSGDGYQYNLSAPVISHLDEHHVGSIILDSVFLYPNGADASGNAVKVIMTQEPSSIYTGTTTAVSHGAGINAAAEFIYRIRYGESELTFSLLKEVAYPPKEPVNVGQLEFSNVAATDAGYTYDVTASFAYLEAGSTITFTLGDTEVFRKTLTAAENLTTLTVSCPADKLLYAEDHDWTVTVEWNGETLLTQYRTMGTPLLQPSGAYHFAPYFNGSYVILPAGYEIYAEVSDNLISGKTIVTQLEIQVKDETETHSSTIILEESDYSLNYGFCYILSNEIAIPFTGTPTELTVSATSKWSKLPDDAYKTELVSLDAFERCHVLRAPAVMPENEYGSLTFLGFQEPYVGSEIITDVVLNTAKVQNYEFLVEFTVADTAFAENEESVTLVMPELVVNGISCDPYLSEDHSSARRITVTRGQTVQLYYYFTMPAEDLELSFHGSTITRQTKEAYDLTTPDLGSWQKYKSVMINDIHRNVSSAQYSFPVFDVEEGASVVLTLAVLGDHSGPYDDYVFNLLVDAALVEPKVDSVPEIVDGSEYWWNITYSFAMPAKDITLQEETTSLMLLAAPPQNLPKALPTMKFFRRNYHETY